jgi:hypothetical protein
MTARAGRYSSALKALSRTTIVAIGLPSCTSVAAKRAGTITVNKNSANKKILQRFIDFLSMIREKTCAGLDGN